MLVWQLAALSEKPEIWECGCFQCRFVVQVKGSRLRLIKSGKNEYLDNYNLDLYEEVVFDVMPLEAYEAYHPSSTREDREQAA